MNTRWHILQPDPNLVQELSNSLGCSPVTAAVLVNRNLLSGDDAVQFMQSNIGHLRQPCAMSGMDLAVERIAAAVENTEKILIFGDYDVDGVTAATLLFEFLRQAGADAFFYLPHRIHEGYGLKPDHIDGVAIPNRVGLILTVDCGSGSHAAVSRAKAAGIDVIITDHHRVTASLPSAGAVVNPKRLDCEAGFEHLAGVGVVMALLICLRKHLRDAGLWRHRPEPNLRMLCDLVALGTVADSVPLVAENRIFVKTGLEVIRGGGSRPGIMEMLKYCQTPFQTIDAEDIAFKIVPRLNAAGRMDHALLAARLLLAESRETAQSIVKTLDELNRRRRETEQRILREIQQHLSDHPEELIRKALVLSGGDWHEGVLGIVAARLVERYYRPVVLISTRNGIGKGSARSIAEFNLYQGLSDCADSLENFGGHGMAAGLKIKPENIGDFKEAFEDVAARTTRGLQLAPEVRIDCALEFDQISDQLIDEIEGLRPFGNGNTEPLFMAHNVNIEQPQIVGQRHRRMRLTQTLAGAAQSLPAIHFNIDPHRKPPQRYQRVAFRLQWNRWNGNKSAQLVIAATDPAAA